MAWKNPDKAFYYFSVPLSGRREWGELIERPLDGKETQLAITADAGPTMGRGRC